MGLSFQVLFFYKGNVGGGMKVEVSYMNHILRKLEFQLGRRRKDKRWNSQNLRGERYLRSLLAELAT